MEKIAVKLEVSLEQLIEFNPQGVFQNFGNKNKDFSQNYFQGASSMNETERSLYQKIIEKQEEEIKHLKSVI
jgi:CII-binding regulator of phage lambda lysogenization HflD